MESDGNLDMFSNFSKLRPIEVILNPGQALYIPPYWLVRSEFMSLSMHLDINSLSDTEVRLAEAQFTDIPLGNFTTDLKQRTVAAQVSHNTSRTKNIYALLTSLRILSPKASITLTVQMILTLCLMC